MKQLTLRVEDELAVRLSHYAGEHGDSVNAYAKRVLWAAVDPALEDDPTTRVRERLSRAGLLETGGSFRGRRPDDEQVARARAAAGKGRPLSDYVREGRD